MVEFQLKLSQSRAIYESFKMMHEDSLFKTFTEAQQRIIEGSWFFPVHFFLNLHVISMPVRLCIDK
jgi:hypothetical protein